MKFEKLIKGNEEGVDTVLILDSDKAFNVWSEHHLDYLKELYILFQDSCDHKKVDWYNHINFLNFTKFVYRNSTKYLSPYL